jgi:MYXO-CTERM domain-containing protein
VVLANVPDLISSSSHYCNVDRVDNPTITACTYREGGLRIFDIANPAQPKEIGYFKPRARRSEVRAGSVFWGPLYAAGAERSVDQSSSNVRIVNGNEFWFTSHDNAFQVVRLDRGGGCTSVGASDAALLLLGLAGLVRWRKPAKHS